MDKRNKSRGEGRNGTKGGNCNDHKSLANPANPGLGGAVSFPADPGQALVRVEGAKPPEAPGLVFCST